MEKRTFLIASDAKTQQKTKKKKQSPSGRRLQNFYIFQNISFRCAQLCFFCFCFLLVIKKIELLL